MYTKFWLENLKERDNQDTTAGWKDNINMDVMDTRCEDVDWIHLNIRVP
jgi:hypothetical protein